MLPARVWAAPLRTSIANAGYNIRRGKTDLYQTKFFPITMEAVGFGIDRYTIDCSDLWEQLREL